MECVLDEELLANIKCSDQEDGDEIDEKMQVEEQLPPPDASAQSACFNGEDSDPLQESATTCNFPWIFEDADVLITEDHLADMVLKKEESLRPAVPKRGRGRPALNSGNYTSSCGQLWSVTRDSEVSGRISRSWVNRHAERDPPARFPMQSRPGCCSSTTKC